MNEADYWLSLEFRICREFQGMSSRQLQYLWCDGFIPENYLLDETEPQINGLSWICNGSAQDQWRFVLFLPHRVNSKSDINWESLLPPENATRWLAFDRSRKYLEIEPSAAIPDLT